MFGSGRNGALSFSLNSWAIRGGNTVARTRTRKPPRSKTAKTSSSSSSKSASPVVLVVEDEPTVRALTESNIAELGYETLSAANATEALALLNGDARVTLLFTDINMPDGPDGLELARQ